jgi:DNA-binding transcriptional LysR family regulator
MVLRQIEMFHALLSAGSVTRAAEQVAVSPGAVSLQIKALSEELNAELFIRAGRQLAPTPAALQLAEYTRQILDLVAAIQAQFQGGNEYHDRRPFVFASGLTTLVYQLGRAIRLIRKRYPSNDFRVAVGSTEQIVQGLRSRSFDLGLISLPVDPAGLDITPLFEEEMLLLRPASGGPHAPKIRPAELSKLSFILYPSNTTSRTIIDGCFQQIGLRPRVIMESEDTEAIKKLVEAGFGCSILPEHALRSRARRFHTARIEGRRIVRTLALARPSLKYPRRLTLSIADLIRSMLLPAKPA